MNKKVRKAVSIVLQHEDEVFFIKRQNFLKAFPGYTAFPGGKVDPADKKEDEERTLLNTLFREGKEELGVDLEFCLSQDPNSSIVKIAKATSPPFNPLRFETYFYLINLSEKIEFDVDENEAKEFGWLRPQVILDEYKSGKRLLVGPVKSVFEILERNVQIENSKFYDFDEGRDYTMPTIEPLKNLIQVMPLSNTILPATRTNSFIIGDDIQILIDPSPKNREELSKYLEKVKGYNIDKIFITHHHKDHHQFATQVSKELNLPLYISKDSHQRIENLYGVSYFEGIEIVIASEGDIVGNWLGQEVRVYEIPGHDEGHLGLAPESMSWFLVGDLFQGVGTVVVGGEEGDMSKYMNSLQRVIDLKPNCVIPSHGIPLGGTNILEKTLLHRKLREKQIKELAENGHSIDEILKIIYFDIPDSVVKYAKANIESHLKKLSKDIGNKRS
ncbi:MAG: glyoxylase-like metal-dependent hydrolase (beta-lactamase superfamily II) [Bacteriovoracaceae bacterium]|jgi:ribonuclease/clavin/mitogillin